MSDYEIGYKKPPRHTRFGPGNRFGCWKRKPSSDDDEILKRVFYTPIRYRQGDKSKCAPRIEVQIRRLGMAAINRDVNAARKLLKMLLHVQKLGYIFPKPFQELTEDDGRLC